MFRLMVVWLLLLPFGAVHATKITDKMAYDITHDIVKSAVVNTINGETNRSIKQQNRPWWPRAVVEFNQGYWVSLASRLGDVDALVAELERYQSQMHQSDYVVLDLRGNREEDSRYAYRIAAALLGHNYAEPTIDNVFGVMPLYKGQLVLLTDVGCFNSCLLMTELFLNLGAVQMGRTTSCMNRYYDANRDNINTSHSKPLGPFKPRYIYSGDISNTQKLKSWVSDLLSADRD